MDQWSGVLCRFLQRSLANYTIFLPRFSNDASKLPTESVTSKTNLSGYKCPKCPDRFGQASDLSKHFYSLHTNNPSQKVENNSARVPIKSTEPKSRRVPKKVGYKCPKCPYIGEATELNEHFHLIHELNPYSNGATFLAAPNMNSLHKVPESSTNSPKNTDVEPKVPKSATKIFTSTKRFDRYKRYI